MNLMPGAMNDRVRQSFDNTLVIDDVNNGDQGAYTCKASNGVGKEAVNTTYLRVISECNSFVQWHCFQKQNLQ